MKIMIINPDYGMTKEQMDYRCEVLQQYVSPDTKLDMKCLTKTRVYLDSMADAVMAGPEILEMSAAAQQDGYDAIVLYCFSDPAIEACRQIVDIPVVGGGQAACLMVPNVGYECTVLVADEGRIPEKRIFMQKTGLDIDRVRGYEPVHAHGLDCQADHEQMLKELELSGRRAIEKNGAQVLVLGCLSFLGVAEELSQRLQIPVIDPCAASVSLAESMVRQHLFSSKRSYFKK